MRSKLQLGLIPFGDDDAARERVDAFARALGTALGTPVEMYKAADYRVLVSALAQGLVDFAWLPPLSAARAVRSGSTAPAAIAIRNGTTSYMTGLLTLQSSGIKELGQVRGARAAWVDRDSASGYVVIRAALRAAGVNLADAFREEQFVRSHAEVAKALREGRADVGATCFNFVAGSVEIARSGYKEHGGLPHHAVRILAHAGPIPSDIFAVHAKLGDGVVEQVQAALVDARPLTVQLAARDLMHADGFARPIRAHAQMLERLFAHIEE